MMQSSRRTPPPPVVDNNPPRPRREAPPVAEPTPAAPPVEPTATAAAPTVEQPGNSLASKLASSTGHDGQAAPDPAAMLLNLAAMRQQQVDPMLDYVADGTRQLRWVQAAVQHYAAMTGRSQQDITRDAMLGVHPIPAELLDAHYQLIYGRPRRS